jgi:hypothetical protein
VAAGGAESKTVAEFRRAEKYVRLSDVSMKTTAVAVVRRVRKVPAPELPNTVELEPPKTAPMSAPFPVCSSTTRIRKIHDKT